MKLDSKCYVSMIQSCCMYCVRHVFTLFPADLFKMKTKTVVYREIMTFTLLDYFFFVHRSFKWNLNLFILVIIVIDFFSERLRLDPLFLVMLTDLRTCLVTIPSFRHVSICLVWILIKKTREIASFILFLLLRSQLNS